MFKFHGISSNINDYSQKWDASTISYCYRQYCYKPRPGIVDQIVLWTGQWEAKLRSPRETGERVRWSYSVMGAKGVQVCKRSTNKSWSSKQGSRPSRLRYNSTRGTGHAYEHHCWDGDDWRTQQHNRERKAEIQGALINIDCIPDMLYASYLEADTFAECKPDCSILSYCELAVLLGAVLG